MKFFRLGEKGPGLETEKGEEEWLHEKGNHAGKYRCDALMQHLCDTKTNGEEARWAGTSDAFDLFRHHVQQ